MGRLLCAGEGVVDPCGGDTDPLGFYGDEGCGPDDAERHPRSLACSRDGLLPVRDAVFSDHRLVDDVRAKEVANLSVVLGESEEAIAYATKHDLLMLPRDAEQLAVTCNRVEDFDGPTFEIIVRGGFSKVVEVRHCDEGWSIWNVKNGLVAYKTEQH